MVRSNAVFPVLVDLITRKTRVDASRIQPASRLIDFGLDSVKTMELVVELEQAFDLSIPDEDLLDMETIGAIADYVERRLAAR
jgi:acyl carrier protein